MKKNIDFKKITASFFIVLVCTILFISILGNCKIASWEAIYTVGQWAMVAVTIFIPILVVILQDRINNDKKDIKLSNQELFEEIQNLKKEFNNTNKSTDQISKNDIYKFICISMSVTTKEISDHFSMDIDKVKDILIELAVVDNMIGTYINSNPSDPQVDTIWFRRKK